MKKVLLYFILLMAIAMAGIVAYVSVSGLLKVFTGAGTLGLLLFSSIEFSKVIATSAIHTYGKSINWVYKGLLSLSIVIAMLITSMGIYGFLSSSYKESFSKMENVDAQVELLENKRTGYQDQLTFIVGEKETLNNTITELTKGLSNNVIQYKDPETGQLITTTSSSTRRALEKQLDKAILRQEIVNVKSDSLNVIIFDLQNEILATKLDNESASELSSLKYLADITGQTMDEVMKWFILLLIIIGDPMAVLMVIVFNKVVNKKDGDTPNDIGGLPMGALIGGDAKEITKPMIDPVTGQVDLKYDVSKLTFEDIYNPVKKIPTDDEIVEKAEQIKLNKIWGKAKEIGDKRREEMGEEEYQKMIEDEPTALAFTKMEEDEELETYDDSNDIIDESILEEDIIEETEETPREPIIPRGEIIVDDIKKNRGFTVNIPNPKQHSVEKIGTNKEIRDHDTKRIFFNRKRNDELTND